MENSFFIFAPGGGYFYNSPQKYRWKFEDQALNDWVEKIEVSKWLWGAYGPGEENYLFTYLDKDGEPQGWMGDGISKILKDWLNENLVNEHTRFALGPDGSFMIWDNKKIRWHGVPDGLQEVIQDWLGPAGWTDGPPRIVTMGTKGSYFAISEYGAAAWLIPDTLPETVKVWKKLKDAHAEGNFQYSDLEYVNLSACNEDFMIYVKKDLGFDGYLPQPIESCYTCFETLLEDHVAQKWRRQREALKKEADAQAKEREERESKDREGQAKARAAEEKAKREQEERFAEELTLAYVLWQTAWEADVTRKKLLNTFPHIPVQVCICVEVSCKQRKVDSGLLACQHDVERLLRASGLYSLAWLRKERIPWHPDRFGLRCDPDFRKELKRKTTEMYSIFETLIEEEKVKNERQTA